MRTIYVDPRYLAIDANEDPPELRLIAENGTLVVDGELEIFALRVAHAVFKATGTWPQEPQPKEAP